VLVVHRYLGIATGALVIMWCLSGIVMIYVPYPRLAERERLDGLPPISWSGCCNGVDAALRAGGIDDLRIEMLAGHPVLRGNEARPSGLLSMNPRGLFEGGEDAADRLHLRGPRMPPGRIAASIEAIVQPAAAWKLEERNAWMPGARSVSAAPLGGKLFFVIQTLTGARLRVDESGRIAPLRQAEIERAAADLAAGARVASVEAMTTEDAYFIAYPGERAPLPVIRVILGDENATRFYLDPLSAEMEAKVDRGARSYRWLHQAFHRLDACAGLRVRPTWDAVVIALVFGVLIVSATGMYLGLRRTSSRSRPGPRRPVG
jgi:hypothetical protein